MTKDSTAAADLWRQIFERAAADPFATVMDPNYDEASDRARFRQAMAVAGWTEPELDTFEDQRRARQASAPDTSPGVNRDVEAMMAQLAADIEAAMDRLGLKSHLRVARGVEPRGGPLAAKIGVIMTDESIVTVGSYLFRFCGLVGRAFARTLRLDPWLWESAGYKQESGNALLRSTPDLLLYWRRIYFSFAVTGTNIGVPLWLSTREEVMLMEQVARAMEIFAVAHEYGHHHLAHGKEIMAEPHRQEFEADQFALRICDEVDRKPVIVENPYLVSGAGGVVLLMALETIRSIEELLGANPVQGETHPKVADRVLRFDSVRLLQPAEFKSLKGFRVASSRIMALVSQAIVPTLAALPSPLLAEIRRLREQMRGPT